MATGALGLGSYQSVIAGTHTKSIAAVFYPLSNYHIYLLENDKTVRESFLVRDKIFDNRMPDGAIVNGHFRLIPTKRLAWHYDRVMTGLRRRTIITKRLERQKLINERVIAEARQNNLPDPRTLLHTPDADAYFRPLKFTGNHWPNFWQHPTKEHLVPHPEWRRYPHLGGITRVIDAPKPLTTHY
ncbi:hypothetical protein XU18_0380 [Perkinsela sp. CCAP 1560/4]|nr:hypothetical protein XU18_0380 [Perkinsela sp. CCAP 1560/4]|eukprot:KNH09695.1 hypothetical protein XU18_0380 [Perkinsela sp. CCAP 1560/4]